MSLRYLPTLNALLNLTCAFLLMAGMRRIYVKDVEAHKRLMVSAFAVSTLFLISYLVYHFNVGSVGFTGTGWIRPVYFIILITHSALAVLVPHPLQGVAGGFRAAPPHRPLDLPHLALCFVHGRRGLLDTLRLLPGGMREFLRALRRGCALMCPRCPEPLFTGPFRMHERCPGCGYLFEREQGYFVGAIYINYAITIIICLGGYLLT
ncbi:MAG: DUF420 domain-containing protein, partial [Nitrospinae bacterium]|nr:DUF420 domain-containing protein [Nitrospinota bacterium]